MKRIYNKPEINIFNVQIGTIICNSLPKSSDPADPNVDILSREMDVSWSSLDDNVIGDE